MSPFFPAMPPFFPRILEFPFVPRVRPRFASFPPRFPETPPYTFFCAASSRRYLLCPFRFYVCLLSYGYEGKEERTKDPYLKIKEFKFTDGCYLVDAATREKEDAPEFLCKCYGLVRVCQYLLTVSLVSIMERGYRLASSEYEALRTGSMSDSTSHISLLERTDRHRSVIPLESDFKLLRRRATKAILYCCEMHFLRLGLPHQDDSLLFQVEFGWMPFVTLLVTCAQLAHAPSPPTILCK